MVQQDNIHPDEIKQADQSEVDDFIHCRRGEYIRQLSVRLTANAGWTGNGEVGRGIKREMGNAMQDALDERAGTERYSAGKTVSFADDDDDLTFTVTYKPNGRGREERTEAYPLLTIDACMDAIRETDEKKTTPLELAIHRPDLYWTLRHHLGNNIESELAALGLLQSKRRRRK
jgi:hypothetical protein